MINVSDEFKKVVKYDSDISPYDDFIAPYYLHNPVFLYYADITLKDGTVLNLTSANIWNNSFKIDDSVSQDNNFDVGDAIINKASFSINNMDESYSDYTFEDATAVMYIGLQLSNSIEKLRKFTGTIDEVKYDELLITVSVLDNMSKFDENFDGSKLELPTTIDTLVRYCCDKCGVKFNTTSYDHKDFQIDALPTDQTTLTYRQIISYCAQICGYFARCNPYGELEFRWYAQEDLTAYSADNVPDDVHEFKDIASHSVGVDDVVITGVQISVKADSSETYLKGSKGYVITIKDNPFLTVDNMAEVGNWLGEKLIGFKFRQATIAIMPDPSVEAGDVGVFFDRKGRGYPIIVSSVTYTSGSNTSIKSSAQTPARNSASTYSQQTKNYVELRKRIKEEADARKVQADSLAARLDSSSGVYTTIEAGTSGSIFYLHNKPTLAESDIIWKMTSEAWGVSTDGGKTYNGGMTVDGDTIARILTATGINANWINTGVLTIKDSDGNVTFSADTATGEVHIKSQNIQMKVGQTYKTLEDYANEMDDTIQVIHDTEAGKIHTFSGTSGTAGYVAFATIKITGSYANAPIVFSVSSRTKEETQGQVIFLNDGSTDPGIRSFISSTNNVENGVKLWLQKTGTSTWRLIAQKSESYDELQVTQYRMSDYMSSRATVTWTNDMLTALPDSTDTLPVIAATANVAISTAQQAETNAKSYADSLNSAVKSLAEAAQKTADSKVTTYYQSETPTGTTAGDLWIKTSDGNKLYRYDGSTWTAVQDTAISNALKAAGDAQSTADGKIVTFAQTSEPTATDTGDIWIDTDDDNHLYRWDGTKWVSYRDGTIAKNLDAAKSYADTLNSATKSLAEAAQKTANAKITTYYQTSNPSGASTGDLWIDTDDGNKLYRYNGTSWVSIQDTAIANAMTAAGDAKSIADGKIVTYAQAAEPTSGSVGDLWIDTDNDNRLYRYNGTKWEAVSSLDAAKSYADDSTKAGVEAANQYSDSGDASVRSEMATQRQEITTEYTTAIEQTQTSLNVSIQQNSEGVKQNADNFEAYKNEQETYFHFTDEGLEIGKTENGATPFSTLLSDQELAFRQNGQDVAYIKYNKMHINAIEAVNRWSVGAASNGGYFDFISTKYGMGVKWREAVEFDVEE